jgi:hypothetical protein
MELTSTNKNPHQNLQYIMKKKRKPSVCKHCKKEYKNDGTLKKHLILCEILNNKQTQLNNMNDTNFILPSQIQLYQIIQELVIKQSKMEEKMDQLQKWVEIKKKKINIIDWLNHHQHPDYYYKNIIELFTIQDTDIDFIYKPDNLMMDLILLLLERNLYEQQAIPLFAFTQKNNMIYYFDSSNNHTNPVSQNTWNELPKEKLTSLLNQIHSKIFNVLMEWRKKHNEFIHSNDRNEVLYCKMMGKFMGIDFKQASILNKIYSSIYNKIKTEKQHFVEYEMDF